MYNSFGEKAGKRVSTFDVWIWFRSTRVGYEMGGNLSSAGS